MQRFRSFCVASMLLALGTFPLHAADYSYSDDHVIAAIDVKLHEIGERKHELSSLLETADPYEIKIIRIKLFILHVKERKLEHFEHKVPYMNDYQIKWLIAHYHLDMDVSYATKYT